MPNSFHFSQPLRYAADGGRRLAALACLLLMLPLLILLAVMIGACGRRPLFRQVRIGRHGSPFVIVKFRTMDGAAGVVRRPLRDAVYRRLAQWLRRSRIDELPQLGNIVLGQMAFVGPRPVIPAEAAAMGLRAVTRHSIRPGLTGLAQLRGGNVLPLEDKLRADLHYVERRSIALNAQILLGTFPKLVRGIDDRCYQLSDADYRELRGRGFARRRGTAVRAWIPGGPFASSRARHV